MSNQASEDRLDTDTQIMHKIDNILYYEHEQPFSKGDALLMLIRNQIKARVRNEKLKLLAEVRERVVDKPTGNHNADSLLERDVLIYNQATAYLRTELTKLEAEL